jgi:hypothetical protein
MPHAPSLLHAVFPPSYPNHKMFGGKKEAGSHGTSRDGGAPNRGLIWAAWLLSTAGFAILLGGVASMQHVSENRSVQWGQLQRHALGCWAACLPAATPTGLRSADTTRLLASPSYACQGCGAGNNLLNLGGAVGYLAPVSCNKLFRWVGGRVEGAPGLH